MKKLKIWSGISLALLGAGSLAVIPSMLTGCSKGAHVVVDYDSVNALKQKDLSIATTADAAFKEWQALSTKDKSIDLWSELITLIANVAGDNPSGASPISNFKGDSVSGGDWNRGNGAASILGILRTIASYLGINISSSTLNYFVQKKLAFDISHSSFKKTTLKNVYYNVAGSSFNQTVSFDSYLWSGDFKLVIKGGLAGMDLSGLTFQFKNIPLSTFHDNMSFAMCPTIYDPSSFVLFGDNTVFDAAGTKFAVTIPSNYQKYINFFVDIFKIMNWQFPNDISQLYNKPIDIPNIALNFLYGINKDKDGYGDPDKVGNFLLNSHIYEYVFTDKIHPGLSGKFDVVNSKNLIDSVTIPWVSSRTASESEWNTNVYFNNGSLANRFVDFKITKLQGQTATANNLKVVNYPNQVEGKLVLKSDDIYTNLAPYSADASKAFVDYRVAYGYTFNATIKEQYKNFFDDPSRDFDNNFVIRQAYNWFVGNTSTTAGYDATLPFQGDTITAYNPSTQFERGLLTADLLDSRDCKWKDNSNVIPSNSFSSFSLVDEHSRYSVPDDNLFYSRKEINADDFTVTAIKNTTTQLPTTYFSLIPSIKSPSTNFAFKIHLTIPSTGSQLSVNDVVDVAINYKTPNEKDLYSATQGGADIDSAHFAVQFKFVNA